MKAQWSLFFVVLVGVVCVVLSVPDLIGRDGEDNTEVPDLCRTPGCKCTEAKTWHIINCTFNNTQRVEFTPGSIPNSTMEISIIGGEEIIIKPFTFNSLIGFRRFRVDDTKRLVTSKSAFFNLTSAKLLLQIQGCDRLIVQANAFKNFQTPISFEATNCSYVSIGKWAFSKLQEGRFQSIPNLEIAEETFKFENQAVAHRHGPVTMILFKNVVISKIPKMAFLSAVAEISIVNSLIAEVNSEAFYGPEISVLNVIESSIGTLRSHSFGDGTLITDFKISKCNISIIETGAIVAPIANFTVEFSRITEIQSGAINSPVITKVIITDNQISTLYPNSLSFNNWNRINFNDNIIRHVYGDFMIAPKNSEIHEFSFAGNEIYKTDPGALSFLPILTIAPTNLRFENNYFDKTCSCDLGKWITELLESASEISTFIIMNTSFCPPEDYFSQCFKSEFGSIGPMSMQNFTEMVCGTSNNIRCEPYKGKTIILETTIDPYLEDQKIKEKNSNLILGLVLGSLLIIAISGTIVILLIRGGIWLKRKGYCMQFRSMHYRQQDPPSMDDEGTIVETEISDDKIDIPDELTPEILQMLRERLEDPSTHEEAREMIERLYEMFIVHDGTYTNNNTQEEEAHLYEELGNLQMANNNQINAEKAQNYQHVDTDETFGILKLMEERYNLISHGNNEPIKKPALAGEYSEPTDAAVHLYSELNQNNNKDLGESHTNTFSPSNTSTFRSENSNRMAFRPLPEKPGTNIGDLPGPSKL